MNKKSRIFSFLLILLLGVITVACTKEKPMQMLEPETELFELTPEINQSLMDLDEWDLVFISDSTGFGVADLIAADIESRFGKKVNVTDLSIGALPAIRVLKGLRGEPVPHFYLSKLPEYIKEAEMVVITGNPVADDVEVTVGSCLGGPWPSEPCHYDELSDYRANLAEIYSLIFSIRGDAPIIVRAFDIWYRPDWWRDASVLTGNDVLSLCMQCMEDYDASIAEVANKFNIPVAHLPDVFNGVDFLESPLDLGYLGDDKEHANEVGQSVIAQAIISLGYDPVTPPIGK